MILIEVIHQSERTGKVSYLEVEPDATFRVLRERLAQQYLLGPDARLSVKEAAEPVDEALLVKDCATARGLKVHILRCTSDAASRREQPTQS